MEEVKQSNDELYSKIETEKLLKEKKRKNVLIITFLSIVFAITVVIICLASIPLNLKPSFLRNTSNINSVSVKVNGSYTGISSRNEDDSEAFSEFLSVLNDAFGQTYFSALFNGSLSNVDIVESRNNSKDSILTDDFLSNSDYVYFTLKEEQNILDGNGNVYTSVKTLNAVPFTFDEAYLVLSEESGVQTASFYVVVRYLDSEGHELDRYNGEYVIEIQTKADTSKIFDHYDPSVD